MIVNMMTIPVMNLEHPEDLSFFHECHTFLYKKLLSGYVRVLDLSSFLPPLLNNVGLKCFSHDRWFYQRHVVPMCPTILILLALYYFPDCF